MATSRVEYLGDLRTKCTHLKSGSVIETVAPVDNNGKGDNFSPTDLVATAYASCMITIIGIYCDTNNIEFKHCTADITKEMASGPRRISAVRINIDLSGNDWDAELREKIIKAAEACPVAYSVSDQMEIELNYQF